MRRVCTQCDANSTRAAFWLHLSPSVVRCALHVMRPPPPSPPQTFRPSSECITRAEHKVATTGARKTRARHRCALRQLIWKAKDRCRGALLSCRRSVSPIMAGARNCTQTTNMQTDVARARTGQKQCKVGATAHVSRTAAAAARHHPHIHIHIRVRCPLCTALPAMAHFMAACISRRARVGVLRPFLCVCIVARSYALRCVAYQYLYLFEYVFTIETTFCVCIVVGPVCRRAIRSFVQSVWPVGRVTLIGSLFGRSWLFPLITLVRNRHRTRKMFETFRRFRQVRTNPNVLISRGLRETLIETGPSTA